MVDRREASDYQALIEIEKVQNLLLSESSLSSDRAYYSCRRETVQVLNCFAQSILDTCTAAAETVTGIANQTADSNDLARCAKCLSDLKVIDHCHSYPAHPAPPLPAPHPHSASCGTPSCLSRTFCGAQESQAELLRLAVTCSEPLQSEINAYLASLRSRAAVEHLLSRGGVAPVPDIPNPPAE